MFRIFLSFFEAMRVKRCSRMAAQPLGLPVERFSDFPTFFNCTFTVIFLAALILTGLYTSSSSPRSKCLPSTTLKALDSLDFA